MTLNRRVPAEFGCPLYDMVAKQIPRARCRPVAKAGLIFIKVLRGLTAL